MARLLRTPQAHGDIQDIWLYIARDSIDTADRWIDKLEQACEKLAERPGLGRARDDLAPGLHGFPLGAYIIFYKKLDDGVQTYEFCTALGTLTICSDELIHKASSDCRMDSLHHG